MNRKVLTECLTRCTTSLHMRHEWPDFFWLQLHTRCPNLRFLDLRSAGPLNLPRGVVDFVHIGALSRSLDVLCAAGGTLERLELPHFSASGVGTNQDIVDLGRFLPRDTCLKQLGASIIPNCTTVIDSVEWLAPLLCSFSVYPTDCGKFGRRLPMGLYERLCKKTASMLSKATNLRELDVLFRTPCNTGTGDMLCEILSTAPLPKLERLRIVTLVLSQNSVDLLDKLHAQPRQCRVSWNGHSWRGKWHNKVRGARKDPYVFTDNLSAAVCWAPASSGDDDE